MHGVAVWRTRAPHRHTGTPRAPHRGRHTACARTAGATPRAPHRFRCVAQVLHGALTKRILSQLKLHADSVEPPRRFLDPKWWWPWCGGHKSAEWPNKSLTVLKPHRPSSHNPSLRTICTHAPSPEVHLGVVTEIQNTGKSKEQRAKEPGKQSRGSRSRSLAVRDMVALGCVQ